MMNILRNIGKSKHERVAEMLSAYLDGEVTPNQRAQVEAHLAQCRECAHNLRTLRQTVNLLGELPAVKAPRSFVIREAQVAPRRRVTGRWQRSYPLLQGATVAVLLLLVIVFAGDMMLTRFAPTLGGAPLLSYSAPAAEEPSPSWVEREQAVVEEVEKTAEVEEIVAMAPQATVTTTEMPAPPAPTGTPVPAPGADIPLTPTPSCYYKDTESAGPPTEEAMAAMEERTAEAPPAPTATPMEVARVPQPEGENGTPAGAASAAVRSPPVGPARIALWTIEGGLLVLAVALVVATLWVRRARRQF